MRCLPEPQEYETQLRCFLFYQAVSWLLKYTAQSSEVCSVKIVWNWQMSMLKTVLPWSSLPLSVPYPGKTQTRVLLLQLLLRVRASPSSGLAKNTLKRKQQQAFHSQISCKSSVQHRRGKGSCNTQRKEQRISYRFCTAIPWLAWQSKSLPAL